MKRTSVLWLILLGVVSIAAITQAEPGDAPRRGPAERDGAGGPPRPPKPPIEVALDTDQDGEISADEIEGAPAALKKLDKNGDGKLTPEEYRPRHPGGPRDRDGSPGERRRPRGSADGQGKPPRQRDGDKPSSPRDQPEDGDGPKDGNGKDSE
jgi:hypothetical protein